MVVWESGSRYRHKTFCFSTTLYHYGTLSSTVSIPYNIDTSHDLIMEGLLKLQNIVGHL